MFWLGQGSSLIAPGILARHWEAKQGGEAAPRALGYSTHFSSWHQLVGKLCLHTAPLGWADGGIEGASPLRCWEQHESSALVPPAGKDCPSDTAPLPPAKVGVRHSAKCFLSPLPAGHRDPSDPTHTTGIKGAVSLCLFLPFTVSVHPRNKLPCEKGFEASQETARSFSRFGNFSCLCLSNT